MVDELIEKADIKSLEDKLGVHFEDKDLLRQAITHRSFPNENKKLNIKDNERLEFLGDSVLGLAISTYLFKECENSPEGELAKTKAILVSSETLAEKARKLDLNKNLLLGRGEEITGGRERESILADSIEAIFGALYLEKGFIEAKSFIISLFKKDINKVLSGEYEKDYKTLLQETVQKDSDKTPQYQVIEELGPDHNKKFVVEVELAGDKLGKGRGSSKKKAEQKAARKALKNLDICAEE